MDVKTAIAKYIEIRDRKDRLKEKHKAELQKYNDALAKIEAALLKFLHKTGQTSSKGTGGTAFIKQRTSDTVTDPVAYMNYIRENEAYDLLESRVAKAALDQFIEEHGDLPPGVRRTIEQQVQIRRS